MATLTRAALPSRRRFPPDVSAPDRPVWSQGTFVLAAAGATIGLGNLWVLPSLVAAHGAAFVLVYLAAVALIGYPLLGAEFMLGRLGRRNPVDAFGRLAARAGAPRLWRSFGWLTAAAALAMLAVYGLAAGWSLAYTVYGLRGFLAAGGPPAAAQLFAGLLADPVATVGWHFGVLACAGAIVAAGVNGGVGRAARRLVPLLLGLVAVMVVYAAVSTDRVSQEATFLLVPDFARLTPEAVLAAIGQACTALALGLGVMVAYGSYAPPDASLTRAAAAVTALDVGVALAAGVAMRALVLGAGAEPASGPALLFVTLPSAIATLPAGDVFATLLFIMLFVAALTSVIALLEPPVSLLAERGVLGRPAATAATVLVATALAAVPALGLGDWAGVQVAGRGLFVLLGDLIQGALLPVVAAGTGVFAAHALTRRMVRPELGCSSVRYRVGRLLVGWIAPGIIVLWLVGRVAI